MYISTRSIISSSKQSNFKSSLCQDCEYLLSSYLECMDCSKQLSILATWQFSVLVSESSVEPLDTWGQGDFHLNNKSKSIQMQCFGI